MSFLDILKKRNHLQNQFENSSSDEEINKDPHLHEYNKANSRIKIEIKRKQSSLSEMNTNEPKIRHAINSVTR